jgi:hypothetical protein
VLKGSVPIRFSKDFRQPNALYDVLSEIVSLLHERARISPDTSHLNSDDGYLLLLRPVKKILEEKLKPLYKLLLVSVCVC